MFVPPSFQALLRQCIEDVGSLVGVVSEQQEGGPQSEVSIYIDIEGWLLLDIG